jgi:hypothetical protein
MSQPNQEKIEEPPVNPDNPYKNSALVLPPMSDNMQQKHRISGLADSIIDGIQQPAKDRHRNSYTNALGNTPDPREYAAGNPEARMSAMQQPQAQAQATAQPQESSMMDYAKAAGGGAIQGLGRMAALLPQGANYLAEQTGFINPEQANSNRAGMEEMINYAPEQLGLMDEMQANPNTAMAGSFLGPVGSLGAATKLARRLM